MQKESCLPTISVITTCYNRATTIRACMESVLRQSYSAVEYVVVDGASAYGSLGVIRRVAAEAAASSVERKAISVISEPDSGMYEAKEYGIEITNGSVEQLKGRFDAVVLGLAHAFSTI